MIYLVDDDGSDRFAPLFLKKKGPTVPVRVCRVGRAIWYASATTPLPGLLYSFLSLYFLFDLFGSQWQMDLPTFAVLSIMSPTTDDLMVDICCRVPLGCRKSTKSCTTQSTTPTTTRTSSGGPLTTESTWEWTGPNLRYFLSQYQTLVVLLQQNYWFHQLSLVYNVVNK